MLLNVITSIASGLAITMILPGNSRDGSRASHKNFALPNFGSKAKLKTLTPSPSDAEAEHVAISRGEMCNFGAFGVSTEA